MNISSETVNVESSTKTKVDSDTAVSEKEATAEKAEKKSKPVKKATTYSSGGVKKADPDIAPRDPVQITLKSLLEAGAHFGHQTSRWNPEMAPYIYGTRNGIHIIDLPKSVQAWKSAREAIVKIASEGGSILFVGTKKQAQQPIMEEAKRCGAFDVTKRWLGGMITNYQTMRKSIERMKKVELILQEEELLASNNESPKFTKKERLMMTRELEKLEFSLGGIRDMYAPPKLIFVVDIKREDIAIKEAKRLDIPVVAIVDTNCNPNKVEHPIPSNDDGTSAVRIFAAAISDAITEGRAIFKKRGGNLEAVREAEEKMLREEEAHTKGKSDKKDRKDNKSDSSAKKEAKAKPADKETAADKKAEKVEDAAPAEAAAETEAPVKEEKSDSSDS